MPSEAFPSSCRLHDSRQFDLVFRKGRRFRGSHITLIAVAAPDGKTRLGLVVKKRINGVVRNRMRRRLKELFRRNRILLPSRPVWIIIHATSPGEVPFVVLRDEYFNLAGRITSWVESS